MQKMTRLVRRRLLAAITRDETLESSDRETLTVALARVPDGAELCGEVPDGTDGTTDLERVELAFDFYFG